jgi:hypothetical protein
MSTPTHHLGVLREQRVPKQQQVVKVERIALTKDLFVFSPDAVDGVVDVAGWGVSLLCEDVIDRVTLGFSFGDEREDSGRFQSDVFREERLILRFQQFCNDRFAVMAQLA